MGTFLIILLIIFLFWPWITKFVSRLLQKYMAHRAEDMMRRMMGMPTRREEERMRRKAAKDSDNTGGKTSRGSGSRQTRRHHRTPDFDAAEVMKQVAEDVEYTEIREFESTTIAETDRSTGKTTIYEEEQVTDAEYVEIKSK